MSELKIIRASAGSGKTFTLAREFLRLVISEPLDYYRKILAVTFTNKATAEMKSRILEELYKLGSGKKSDHLDFLIETSKHDEKFVRQKSAAILSRILHGYSWFRTETIDSFFQGIIRSFLLELGIPGHFNTEINHDQILNEAVDRFLNNLEADSYEFRWLKSHIEEKLSEGKSWGVKKSLIEIGNEIFKEIYQENASALEEKLNDPQFIENFRNELKSITESFEKKIEQIVDEVFVQIDESGFTLDDFAGKKGGPINFFAKLKKGAYLDFGVGIYKVLENPDNWSNKTHKRAAEIIQFGTSTLNPAAEHIFNIFETERPKYYAAKIILKKFYFTGLLARLSVEIKKVKQEKGIMLLSDAAPFINRIINDNDTPFIYEKIGTRFNHLLIDEFQDTSKFQYKNFKPLLSNSLSFGNDCLLVGDVKQAIYRWRNGNWEILAKEVVENFGDAVKPNTLDTNWRSQAQIVNFNNAFFSVAPLVFDENVPKMAPEYIPAAGIYADTSQQISPKNKNDSGYVSITLFEKKENQDEFYFGEELIRQINLHFEKGFEPGDMAVLVSTGKEGKLLSEFIVEANTKRIFSKPTGVISNESLFLSGSPAISLLVSAMQFISEPDNKLKAAALLANYRNVHTVDETEIVELTDEDLHFLSLDKTIAPNFIETSRQLACENLFVVAEKLCALLKLNEQDYENVYIHSFLDIVYTFSKNELNDLTGFLNFWEEEGAKKTIRAAETSGSIKILTIHRSKGLEFPVVLIPFTEWNVKPKSRSLLWIEPQTSPFNGLPTFPVNFEQLIESSEFAEQFYTESYLTLIDKLNLLYVAFTRAVSSLVVFAKHDSGKTGTVADLISLTLSRLSEKGFIQSNNETQQTFTLGHLHEYTSTSNNQAVSFLKKSSSQLVLPDIRISNAVRFADENIGKSRYEGTALHAIMENLILPVDLENAIRKVVQSGLIRNEEIEVYRAIINKALENEHAKDWFSTKYKVMTETDIILAEGSIKRPDRLMISGNEIIVIDYKFGHETENPKHIEQVKSYLNTLSEMEYAKVNGYVWYVTQNSVREVV